MSSENTTPSTCHPIPILTTAQAAVAADFLLLHWLSFNPVLGGKPSVPLITELDSMHIWTEDRMIQKYRHDSVAQFSMSCALRNKCLTTSNMKHPSYQISNSFKRTGSKMKYGQICVHKYSSIMFPSDLAKRWNWSTCNSSQLQVAERTAVLIGARLTVCAYHQIILDPKNS